MPRWYNYMVVSYAACTDELRKIAASKARMTVSQTRKGRRSMRVDTMLRKEKDGSLYKQSGARDEARRYAQHSALNLGQAARDVRHIGSHPDADKVADKGTAKHVAASVTSRVPSLASNLYYAALPPQLHHTPEELDQDKGKSLGRMFSEGYDPWKHKLAADYGKNSAGYDLQGKTEFQGLPIAIENRKGSVRSGVDDDGSKWKTKYKLPYGYIEGTKGADGEEVDAYVGPVKDADKAFVVRQKKSDGSYDEDTVMLGFKTKADAKKAILQHYDDPKHIGKIVPMAMEKLKGLVSSKKKLIKLSSTSVPASQVGGGSTLAPSSPPTGRPARGKRKPGDVPSLDEPSTYPKVEESQTNQSTTALVSAGGPAGG